MPETVIDLGKRVKAKYPGQYDDLADEELGRKVKAKYPADYADFTDVSSQFSDTVKGSSTTAKPPSPLLERAKGFAGSFGVPTSAADAPSPGAMEKLRLMMNIPQIGGPMMAADIARKTASDVMNAPENLTSGDPRRQGEAVGGLLQALLLAGGAAKAGKGAMPSKAAAGAKFDAVMAKAKDVPLDLGAADDAVIRAQELQGRGSTLPKVLRDYIKQREAGQTPTYEVGRDFASNAGNLSAREATALNGKMHRQVSTFAEALDTANRKAAESVGLEGLYDEAMTEYSRARSIENKKAVAAKYLKRAAIIGVTGKLLFDINDSR